MSKNRILVLLAVLIMSTLACQAADNLLNTGAPSEGQSSEQAMTKVAEYIGVGMTQTALSGLSLTVAAPMASPTMEQVTDTPLPPPILPEITLTTPLVAPLPSPQPPQPEVATKSACTYKAYLDYETIPYGKEMPYNHAFTKVWRVRNAGNCAWEPGFELMCLKYCNDFGAPGSVILNGRVIKPGDQVEVRVDMHAPKDKKLLGKTVVSTWMIRGGGKIFGIQPDGDTALTVAVKITD
jgi:hypothetical protein